MLNDLNETLKQMLVTGVPLDTAEIDVVFEAPTEEWSSSLARPTVNCYLYHLVENRELRHNDWEIDPRSRPARSNGNGGNNPPHIAARRHVPYRIDAHYMLTAWANEVEDEHRLLWRMLAALMRYQMIPWEMLQGDLAGEEWPIHLKVAQPESIMKNPADFWSGMEGHIKPTINLIVTLPLDPEMFTDLPLVLTRRIKMRPTLAEVESYELNPVQFGGWVYTPGDGGKTRTPVTDAQVTIVERGLTVQTDEAGRFKFDRVARGRYTLRAVAGSRQTERTVELPGEDYDLVFAADEDSGVKGSDREPPGRQGGPQKDRRR
jgi:hypothetical protein